MKFKIITIIVAGFLLLCIHENTKHWRRLEEKVAVQAFTIKILEAKGHVHGRY